MSPAPSSLQSGSNASNFVILGQSFSLFFPLQNGNFGPEINKNFSKRHEGASVELGMNVLFLELGSGYTYVFNL